MSSTNHTPNLSLPQWVGTDPVLMSDFNDAFSAIDAALNGSVKLAAGSYVGNGQCGSSKPNTLSFAFAPKLVLIKRSGARTPYTIMSAGDTATVSYAGASEGGEIVFSITGNSVSWYHDNMRWSGMGGSSMSANSTYQLNDAGVSYSYIAFG